MATRKSAAEKLADLQKKMQQLEVQEKQLRAKASQEARKADTKSKIKLGGALIKALRDSGYSVNAVDLDEGKLIAYIIDQERRGGYVGRALGLTKEAAAVAASEGDSPSAVAGMEDGIQMNIEEFLNE